MIHIDSFTISRRVFISKASSNDSAFVTKRVIKLSRLKLALELELARFSNLQGCSIKLVSASRSPYYENILKFNAASNSLNYISRRNG